MISLLISLISYYSDIGTILNLRTVCREWKNIIDTNNLIWRRFIKQMFSLELNLDDLKVYFNDCKNQKEVFFAICRYAYSKVEKLTIRIDSKSDSVCVLPYFMVRHFFGLPSFPHFVMIYIRDLDDSVPNIIDLLRVLKTQSHCKFTIFGKKVPKTWDKSNFPFLIWDSLHDNHPNWTLDKVFNVLEPKGIGDIKNIGYDIGVYSFFIHNDGNIKIFVSRLCCRKESNYIHLAVSRYCKSKYNTSSTPVPKIEGFEYEDERKFEETILRSIPNTETERNIKKRRIDVHFS